MDEIVEIGKFLRKIIYLYGFNFLFKKRSTFFDKVLNQYIKYYQNLPFKDKAEFRRRVAFFISDIEFSSHGHSKVTEEMKVVISSAFVILTFGLDKVGLNEFYDVIILEKPYKYSYSENYYLGDVNAATGKITLVWPYVKKGFLINDNSVNLALHEISHALVLEEYEIGYYYGESFPDRWLDWRKEYKSYLNRIRKKKSFLRDYASGNHIELFAVSVECFFEEPLKLKEYEPSIYKLLVKILNQVPQ